LEQIAGYIDMHGEIANYSARLLTGKSDVSVKKYLARLAELGILKVEGKNKGRKYVINKK
jgi:predicted HTH transcriptional regulator